MSIDVSTTAASAYFAPANHVAAALWAGFSPEQQQAGLAHATRRCSREIGKDLTAETVNESDQYHPDYAIFEQALYMLVNSTAVPNGEETGPHYYAADDPDGDTESPKPRDVGLICAEAARWLRRPMRRIRMVRG